MVRKCEARPLPMRLAVALSLGASLAAPRKSGKLQPATDGPANEKGYVYASMDTHGGDCNDRRIQRLGP